jgi:RsiW-degrading membrane proteinase PrsW (M82 family)
LAPARRETTLGAVTPLAWLPASALPLAAHVAMVPRMVRLSYPAPDGARRASVRVHGSLAAGLVAGVVGTLFERWFSRFTGVEPHAQTAGDFGSIVAMLLLFAPVEESLKLAAVWPTIRSRWVRDRLDAVVHACAVAIGYATIETGAYLREAPAGAQYVARALLAVPSHVFFAAAWGYLLGRARSRSLPPGRDFFAAWLVATALRGLYDHLVFGRGLATVFAALPLLAAMAAVAWFAARDLVATAPASGRSARRTFLPSLPPPPSLRARRAALRRAERPVMLRWIAIGALVTTGVMIASVVGAVLLARRIGVDFSVVDEGEVTSTVPLVLLGSAVLVAFPVAGFLVARASATDSVLEPAMAAGLAIVATLVMLGLAAPVALVFALAFAPVAFGLACAGAWVGIGGAR